MAGKRASSIVTTASVIKKMKRGRSTEPENVLLVYMDDDPDGIEIAEYYAQRRGVPRRNFVPVNTYWSATNTGEYSLDSKCDVDILNAICDKIDELKDKAKVICLCGHFPTIASQDFTAVDGGNPPKQKYQYEISFNSVLSRPFRSRDTSMISRASTDNWTDIGRGNREGPEHYVLPFFAADYPKEERALQGPDGRLDNYAKFYAELSGAREWQPGTWYNKGDKVFTIGSLNLKRLFICSQGGKSDPVTPPDVSTDLDGTCIWQHHYVRDVSKYLRHYTIPRGYRLPNHQYTRLQKISNRIPSFNWKHYLTYSVIYLDAPHPAQSDPDNTDGHVGIVKRMIDDAIAVEQEGHTKLPGTKLLGGTTKGTIAAGAYAEMVLSGHDMSEVYHQRVRHESGISKIAHLLPTVDNLPPGAKGTLIPTSNPLHKFVQVTDIFLHTLGNDAYHSQNRTSAAINHQAPIRRSDIGYRQGAICLAGRSMGATPGAYRSIDFWREVVTIFRKHNTSRQNAKDRQRSVRVPSVYGTGSVPGFCIYYSGAATSAEFEVTADNTIKFYQDGNYVTPVATFSLNDDTCEGFMSQMKNIGLPADWHVSLQMTGCESRAMRALREGAAVAIGVGQEPWTKNATSSDNLVNTFISGGCLADFYINNILDSGKSGGSTWVTPLMYGDPLYKPCKVNDGRF